MSPDELARPTWHNRLLAAAFYSGFAPWLKLFRLGRGNAFVQHHYRQAMGVLLVLLVLLLLAVLGLAYSVYLLINDPEDFRALSTFTAANAWNGTLLAGFVGWLLVGLLGIGLALKGSVWPIPLVGRVAQSTCWVRTSLAGNCLLWSGVFLILGVAWHTATLIRDDDRPARVYFLCDDRPFESIPLWVRNLRFYRVALAAQDRWGPGSVVVAPLTEKTLKQALRHGRFVVLWGHGDDGVLITRDDGSVQPLGAAPAEGAKGKPGSLLITSRGRMKIVFPDPKKLQFVYITGCNAGVKAADWEGAFAPAEVITFPRYSGGMEHILWALVAAPRRLEDIKE
jgi:hypothetical protein